MYTSYNGWPSRSQSTTDMYRMSASVSELGDDSSYAPPCSYSTLSRIDSRRRHETAVSSANISRERSYLTDDLRKQFERGFESSTSNKANGVEDAPPSNPRSNNFVKRLVETLERQQSEQQQQQQRSVIGGSKIANHEFYKIGGVGHDERVGQEQPTMLKRVPRVYAVPLEDLCEHEDEYTSPEDNYSYYLAFDEQRETSTTQENESNTTSKSSISTKITTARRTLKNFISTIKRWRLGPKSLPKGSRDYYATRESLGEEMRVFHRDTLPQLMKHAQIKNLGVTEQRNKKLQTSSEFSKSMDSPSAIDEKRQQPITATIIRSSQGAQGRLSRFPDVARVQSELLMAGEVLRGSKKVESPSLPSSPEAPEPELLVRWSKLPDITKIYASDSGKMQLRRCLPPQLAASTTTPDFVYDVPRPITPITEDVIIQNRLWTSASREYANISSDDNDEDKRLHCTSFTTLETEL